jgi:lipopolysaccharide export system protein LptC
MICCARVLHENAEDERVSGRQLTSDGPNHGPDSRHTGGYLLGASGPRDRVAPAPRRIARRRFLITLTKWLLPMAAMALLASIAVWPEIQDATTRARLSMNHVSGEVEGGKLLDARYNGVDEKGRPYTITAATAWQIDPARVGLTNPKGDITLENGTWLMLTSKEGTFMQHLNQLDLVKDVTLYRDDGTTMHTESATIDLKAGAAAGSEPTHVEGPFGVLDARGFTVMDKGTSIDFPGPAHLVLNGVEH